MKRKLVYTILVALQFCWGWSQYVVKSAEELGNLKSLPQEKVYISHTGPIAFSGEYFYYGFQCFNAQNGRVSNVSKIGYMALVNEEGEYVIEQKIKLNKGLGQGDFFITTNVPSGNYKLLGYTQWMKNNGLSQVFQDDLVIINPYAADQSRLLGSDPAVQKQPSTNNQQTMDSSTVGLLLNKREFTKREKVNLSLKNYKGYLGNGSYTVKVQKLSDFGGVVPTSAINYANTNFNVGKQINLNVGDSLFLPEQRGELLFGSVIDKSTKEPIKDEKIIVSLPGKEFVLKFATTDAGGNFYTYLRKDYKEAIAVIQSEASEKNLNIKVESPRKLDVSKLQYGKFQLNEEMAGLIKKRSIYNQIENQFFTLKPDSVLLGDPIDPFDGGIPETVVLDEYTRFPTFQETLVEILNNAGYRKNPNGNDYVRILQDFETFDEDYNSFPAIVLIDGVFIANHERIKDFDAKTIKSISLIRDQFQLANEEYQGIMAIETFDGNYYENYGAQNGISTAINKPHPKKNYYVQTYGNPDFERIPDYRTLLFWKPNVLIEGNNIDFEFYTSDITGEYEIIVDGFTSYGKPISFTQSIVVK